MKIIRGYLKQRGADKLDVVLRGTEALDALAAAGQQIDALLVKAEAAKAACDDAEAPLIEETVQTLGALSREAWVGHAAALAVVRGMKQLDRVETALSQAVKA